MHGEIRTGYLTTEGAAMNVEIGFIPDYFMAYNYTDGEEMHEWFYGFAAGYSCGTITTAGPVLKTSNGITKFAGEAPGKILTATVNTAALAAGARALTATASQFEEELKVGDKITIVDSTHAESFTIASITNDTSCTTVEACSVAFTAGDIRRDSPRAPGVTLGTDIAEDGKVIYWLALRGARSQAG